MTPDDPTAKAPETPHAEPIAAAAPAERSVFDLPLHELRYADPLRWLALGWRDFRRAPAIGLFYGACFAGMGWLLLAAYQRQSAWTLALSAGFLLMGPFLCLGLYDVSRKLERGERPDFGESLFAWDARTGAMAIFGAVLLIVELIWARASLVVFAISFDGMPDFKGSIATLLDPANLGFLAAYVAVGGVFAGLIFAISVIAMPMILDRHTDAISAALTSLRLCLTQTGVMLWWGALITALVTAALLPWFLGLLVVAPVLGHASWHAYRAAVGD
jgi:uncharacterized membrane protein